MRSLIVPVKVVEEAMLSAGYGAEDKANILGQNLRKLFNIG
jgi:hypothetical protein